MADDAPPMPRLPPAAGALTRRQRLALASETQLSAGAVMAMADEEFTMAFFQAHGVRASHLRVAKLNPLQLKARGVASARDLRALEFNALDLGDPAFCASCIAAHGVDEVVSEFLITANDAVAVAGTAAVHQLKIGTGLLLLLRAGAPVEAASVLKLSLPRGEACAALPPRRSSTAGCACTTRPRATGRGGGSADVRDRAAARAAGVLRGVFF